MLIGKSLRTEGERGGWISVGVSSDIAVNRDGNLWDEIVNLKKMHGTVEIMASAHSIVSNLCKVHVASHEDVSSLPLGRIAPDYLQSKEPNTPNQGETNWRTPRTSSYFC